MIPFLLCNLVPCLAWIYSSIVNQYIYAPKPLQGCVNYFINVSLLAHISIDSYGSTARCFYISYGLEGSSFMFKIVKGNIRPFCCKCTHNGIADSTRCTRNKGDTISQAHCLNLAFFSRKIQICIYKCEQLAQSPYEIDCWYFQQGNFHSLKYTRLGFAHLFFQSLKIITRLFR